MSQKSDQTRDNLIHEAAAFLTGKAVDDGQLVALGLAAMVTQSYPNWRLMPPKQREDLKTAFFGGAAHVFGSIMTMLDPGEEPTERDLRRIDLIHDELQAFIGEYAQRHGVPDPAKKRPQ